MVPVASVAFQAAGAIVLVATIGMLVQAYRGRGAATRSPSRLERAQAAAITIAAVGLAVSAFVDSEVISALWTAGVFATLGIALLRWRRNERPVPDWL